MRRAATATLALAALLAWSAGTANAASLPPIKHVWIVVLENKDYATTFDPNSAAPYLSKTLTSKGQLLTQYYGTGHSSLDNYITMLSGQPPTTATQGDCGTYSDFVLSQPVGADGIAHGDGCVYPTEIKTVSDQLEAAGLTWKGYMEDQGNSPPAPATCRHPAIGAADDTEAARANDQYATKHDPFVYFHSIIDRQAACDAGVVDLSALPGDLASASTTPSYSFITPDLCSDGHDANCADGGPGGLTAVNNFLTEWIPKITDSPAYAEGGLVIITFDEAAGDAGDCCGEPPSPNTTSNGRTGNGGGRIGAVLLSKYIKAGGVNDTPYNHYSQLRTIEDLFGLTHLGYSANDGLKPFGEDVFTQPSGVPDPTPTPTPTPTPDINGAKPSIKLKHVPHACVRRAFTAKITVKSKRLKDVRVYVDRHKITTRKTHSFSTKVRIKKLRAGKHKLVVSARDKKGRETRKNTAFRVCKP